MNLTRQIARSTLLAAALLSVQAADAGSQELFVLEDVRGDDVGNGELIYPNRIDMQRGDLDLVRLSAEQRSDGVWFVAEFAKQILSPEGRVTELGQTPLEKLARNGFFTFSVDIYVDTDRIAGGGRTEAVPGRRVSVDRNFAWEKAIVLTPRPDVARTMLQDGHEVSCLDEDPESHARLEVGLDRHPRNQVQGQYVGERGLELLGRVCARPRIVQQRRGSGHEAGGRKALHDVGGLENCEAALVSDVGEGAHPVDEAQNRGLVRGERRVRL